MSHLPDNCVIINHLNLSDIWGKYTVREGYLLKEHKVHDKLFDLILEKLESKWAFLKRWTVVDSTIVQAASSTKNKDKQRDPDMKSTKKWNNYQFWMKVCFQKTCFYKRAVLYY